MSIWMESLALLPKKSLSHLAGWMASRSLPSSMNQALIRRFAEHYQINLEEAEKPLGEYQSLQDFFTRRLKEEARPLAETPLVHPADAVITKNGEIEGKHLMQAKGLSYSVDGLLVDPYATDLCKGGYYLTYYLAPKDYHRVHSPCQGLVEAVTWVPGKLWPVNSWSVGKVPELFVVNERVVVRLKTEAGPLWLVMVGATNVGSIRLSFLPEFRSNRGRIKDPVNLDLGGEPIQLEKGQELGLFELGSTVILVLSAPVRAAWLNEGESDRAGVSRVRASLI